VNRQFDAFNSREGEVVRQAQRQEFETRLHRALEVSTTEADVVRVAEQALSLALDDRPAELLVADSSKAHLNQIVVTGSLPGGPGCDVESPADCPAVRRGQTQIFDDSADLDACPHLKDRAESGLAGICVPVSIGGESNGVLHTAAPIADGYSHVEAGLLETISDQIGGRLGTLRAFAATEMQASTDPLTGLLNRRSLADEVHRLRRDGRHYSLAICDLDQFKSLNDTHGHEAGDRSLRIFASVLESSARSVDFVSRHGGEEFVVVLRDQTEQAAAQFGERVRENLVLALADGTVPPFTTSFGVTVAEPGMELDDVIARADEALMFAKEAGRNRVVTTTEMAAERDVDIPAQ
jgi:diguanylate cyclase (GGDEF)-like protein